jgi:hypothetical protein
MFRSSSPRSSSAARIGAPRRRVRRDGSARRRKSSRVRRRCRASASKAEPRRSNAWGGRPNGISALQCAGWATAPRRATARASTSVGLRAGRTRSRGGAAACSNRDRDRVQGRGRGRDRGRDRGRNRCPDRRRRDRAPPRALERRGVASDATARHVVGSRRASRIRRRCRASASKAEPRRSNARGGLTQRNLGAPVRGAGSSARGGRPRLGAQLRALRRRSDCARDARGPGGEARRRAPTAIKSVSKAEIESESKAEIETEIDVPIFVAEIELRRAHWSAEAARPTRRLGTSWEVVARRAPGVDAELRPRRPNLGAPMRGVG